MIVFGVYLIAALLYGFPLATAVQRDSACECIGVDYSDAGSYLIDSGVDGNFSFASEFQGWSTHLHSVDGMAYLFGTII